MTPMHNMTITKTRLLAAAVVLGVALAPLVVRAQSRQDQQMLQEIRMLQEQVQQLRSAVAVLVEQAKAANARLDSQAELDRKNHADDSDTLRAVQTQVGALTEKMNLYAQQVGRFSAEIPSLRAGLEQQQKQLDKMLGLLAVPTPTAPANVSSGTPAPPGTALPASPQASFTYARSLYASGDNDLAVKAFTDFLDKFPDATEYLGEANYWIGMSLFNTGKYPAAVTALQTVIDKYKSSERVPDAYFQLGECYRVMGKPKDAVAAYDQVIKLYPDSSAALQAKARKGTIK